MNARLMAASAAGGFALAALLFSVPFSGQTSAQPPGSAQGNGLFGGLRVGQMVQLWSDGFGPFIRTFEDEDRKDVMLHKVKEIGNDYIVLETDDKNDTGSLIEARVPIYRLGQVVHLGKSTKTTGPGAVGTAPEKKPSVPEKKPTTKNPTKKKN